ncbi:hypothetical protein KQ246_19440 (plasmid) [Pseudoalteromonas shioyasakiensis]|nr:hypothetical protein KQ246_19440 [Pseudoalteromonas shioyasakiensis]
MFYIQELIVFLLIYQEISTLYWGWIMARKNTHVDVLLCHFKDNVWQSFKNIRVISYVAVSVLFVGGAGIWMPWVKEVKVTTWLSGATVFTYCFALLGSIICNRLYFYTKSLKEIKNLYKKGLSEEEVEEHFETHEVSSILSAWGMIFGSVIIILITIAYSKYYSADSIYGWLGLLLSLLLYLVASAEDLDKDSSINDLKDKQEADPLVPADLGEATTELNSDFFSNGN